MSNKMKYFIYEWENLLDCFYNCRRPEGWYHLLRYKETLDSLCDVTIRFLQPVQLNSSKNYRMNFLSISYSNMKKILPRIKIVYYQKAAELDYHSSNIVLKMWRKVEKCLLLLEYKKANIFYFLDKKLGEDLHQQIFEFLVPIK